MNNFFNSWSSCNWEWILNQWIFSDLGGFPQKDFYLYRTQDPEGRGSRFIQNISTPVPYHIPDGCAVLELSVCHSQPHLSPQTQPHTPPNVKTSKYTKTDFLHATIVTRTAKRRMAENWEGKFLSTNILYNTEATFLCTLTFLTFYLYDWNYTEMGE